MAGRGAPPARAGRGMGGTGGTRHGTLLGDFSGFCRATRGVPPARMSAQDEAGASSAEEKSAYTYAPYTGGNAIVSAYWVERYERDAARYWDLFYRRNADHFFKDRHYLPAEWSELRPGGATPSGSGGNETATGDDDADGTDGVVSESRAALLAGKAGCAEAQPRVLLEAGCGVGNTLFPLMRLDSTLCVYALDFSSTAVSLVRAHPLAASGRLTAAVGDLTTGAPPAYVCQLAPHGLTRAARRCATSRAA